MSAPRWTCLGSVCGDCGVQHRTREAAAAHCDKHDRDIKSGNGAGSYSDRSPVKVGGKRWRRWQSGGAL